MKRIPLHSSKTKPQPYNSTTRNWMTIIFPKRRIKKNQWIIIGILQKNKQLLTRFKRNKKINNEENKENEKRKQNLRIQIMNDKWLLFRNSSCLWTFVWERFKHKLISRFIPQIMLDFPSNRFQTNKLLSKQLSFI